MHQMVMLRSVWSLIFRPDIAPNVACFGSDLGYRAYLMAPPARCRLRFVMVPWAVFRANCVLYYFSITSIAQTAISIAFKSSYDGGVERRRRPKHAAAEPPVAGWAITLRRSAASEYVLLLVLYCTLSTAADAADLMS